MGNSASRKPGEKPAAAVSKKKNETTSASSVVVAAAAPPRLTNKTPTPTTISDISHVYQHVTVSLEPTPGDIWERYEKVQHLANGSTCQVWTVQSKSPTAIASTQESPYAKAAATALPARLYALKVISKEEVTPVIVEELRNEVRILRSLDHPGILRVYEWAEDGRHLYMVMEHLAGGDLTTQAPYSEADAARVLTRILSAVAYLHRRGVVHRDLKPENIVYERQGGEPKIIDFGLSKQHITRETLMKCRVGTLLCMSPEVLRGQYTSKADVWSIGTIAYTLISGKRPFGGENNREIANQILDGKPYSMQRSVAWKNISADAKEFVQWLMTHNPEKRPSATKALTHPWLRRMSRRLPSDDNTTSGTDALSRVHNALLIASGSSAFDKLVAMMIAYETPSAALEEYREAFETMDPAHTGSIKYFQFRSALKKSQCNLSESDMKQIFQGMDIDESGAVDYTEFLALALLAQGRFEEDQMAKAFHKLDVDKNGTITKEDLCKVLGKQCCTVNCDNVVQIVMEKYDADHDGAISLSDFMRAFRTERREILDDTCCTVLNDHPPTPPTCKATCTGCS